MTLKEKLQINKAKFELTKSCVKGNVLPFGDEVYDKLREYYHGAIPANVYMKYLKPLINPGQCYERSMILSSAFDNAKMVRGDRIDYIISFGIDHAFHWWVEADGWCYCPTTLLKYKKEEYYKIFKPINIKEMTKDEIVNSYYYKEMIHKYPNESFFISNLIVFEAYANLLSKGTKDDEILKEYELFKKKIGFVDDNYDEEKIMKTVKKMKEDVLKSSMV